MSHADADVLIAAEAFASAEEQLQRATSDDDVRACEERLDACVTELLDAVRVRRASPRRPALDPADRVPTKLRSVVEVLLRGDGTAGEE